MLKKMKNMEKGAGGKKPSTRREALQMQEAEKKQFEFLQQIQKVLFHFVDINPDEIAEYRDQIDNLIDKFVSGAVSRETKEFEKLKYLDLNTLKKFVEALDKYPELEKIREEINTFSNKFYFSSKLSNIT